MTQIENLKDKIMLVENAVNNNNQKTTKFLTNSFTFYHSVLTDKVFTLSNHLVESNKLFASFESVVQDSNFDLLTLSQLEDLSIKDSVGENLIEL